MSQEFDRHAVIVEHFYQPSRRAKHDRVREYNTDPTGIDWNNVIAHESYIPQLERGTLDEVSFDFYATIREEMSQLAPEQVSHLRESMRSRGVGDPYLHVLLPDLNMRDKSILIGAGRNAFIQQTGTAPQWLWVPETALDKEVLAVAKQNGYTGVLCAPEQVAANSDVSSQPVRISLNGDGEILLLPFDRPFSSSLAFDSKANADEYTHNVIIPRLMRLPVSRPLVGCTDGETFGHHAHFADLFLQYLVKNSLPQAGITMLGLNQLTDVWQADDYVQGELHQRTAWSCPHGNLQRWHGPCGCQDGDQATWKAAFSNSLQRLNGQVSAVLDAELPNDWSERLAENFSKYFMFTGSANSEDSLLAAKASALGAMISCGTFFGDPQTSGRINVVFARQAAEHLRDAQHGQLADQILQELSLGLSQGTDQHTNLPLNEVFGDLLSVN